MEKKDKPEHLSDFFSTIEFSCKCSHGECIDQKISVELINRLDWLRKASNSPLRIHSGFRCSKHQNDIRNSGISTVVATLSTHELGKAVDCSSSRLIPGELLKLAEHQFKSIGIANNYLHLDLRDDKIRRWKY